MSHETWHKGYQEVKNVIHNEMGITKEEILEIFRQVAKDEIQKIVSDNKPFVLESIREVIRSEMLKVIHDDKYPKVRRNIWNYYNDDNKFKDFITDVLKEEIIDAVRDQFEFKFEIDKKQK